MGGPGADKLALIIRSRPYAHRAARADLDFALAAAAMGVELEIFFMGDALLQLADQRDPKGALLTPGYRAWAALPDLVDTRLFAEAQWAERFRDSGIDLIMPIESLSRDRMRQAWRDCSQVMVL